MTEFCTLLQAVYLDYCQALGQFPSPGLADIRIIEHYISRRDMTDQDRWTLSKDKFALGVVVGRLVADSSRDILLQAYFLDERKLRSGPHG